MIFAPSNTCSGWPNHLETIQKLEQENKELKFKVKSLENELNFYIRLREEAREETREETAAIDAYFNRYKEE